MSDEQGQVPPGPTRPAHKPVAGRLLRVAISNTGRNCITFVVGLFLTPMLIGMLGLPIFGLFMFLAQFTNWMIAPIRTALTGAMVLHLTRAMTARDDAALRRYFTAGLALTVSAGSILVCVGILLSIFARHLLKFDADLATGVRTAIVFESLIIAGRIAVSPYLNLQIAAHRMVTYNINETIQRLADLAALLIVMGLEHFHVPFLGLDHPTPSKVFIAYVTARFTLRFGHNLTRCITARLCIPAAKISISEVTKADIKEIAGVGAWSTADPLIRMSFFMADNYFLNIFLGPVYNGLYGLINQLRGYGRVLGGQLILGTEAITTSVHETKQVRRTRAILFANMRFVGGFCSMSSVVVVCYFKPIIDVWLGAKLRRDPALLEIMTYEQAVAFAQSFTILLLIGGYVMETILAGTKVLYGMGMIRKYSLPMVLVAVLKVIISYIVLRLTGVPILLAWITLVCELVLFGFYVPRIIIRECNISFADFFSHAFTRPILSAVPVVLLCLGVRMAITHWGYFELGLAFILAWIVSTLSLVFILMLPSERASVMKLLTRRFARTRHVAE